jgi:hypothetical protein
MPVATCARSGCPSGQSAFGRKTAGVMLDGHWFCCEACLEFETRTRLQTVPAVPARPADPWRMKFGSFLLANRAVTAVQIAEAEAARPRTGLKLGEQLIAMGFTTPDAVLKALSQQQGVPYLTRVNRDLVRRAPGGLSPHAVRALGLVPFGAPAGGEIPVATTAPVRWSLITVFRRITGWTPKPHLMGDADVRALIDLYGADADALRAPEFVQTDDVSKAAAVVARVASASRMARTIEARCDPFTWIRVNDEAGVHDVVLAGVGGA